MARATPDRPAASPDVAPDALGLLTRDHRLIEELFAEFERSAPQQLDPLARRICKLLRVHTRIEEDVFYPAMNRALPDPARADRANREHDEVRNCIARVESMTSDHPAFKQAIAYLSAQVAQHVGEEELNLFPQLRHAGLDLVALAVALAERRDTLLDVLGLHDDDEEGAANQREIRRPSAAQRRGAAKASP